MARELEIGDRVRDASDGERGVVASMEMWPGGPTFVLVDFERHGRCRVPLRRLRPDEEHNARGDADGE